MARRQEQESARREVEEVAPGILRMQLPIRMPGLGHVNMYALLDDEGAAVVDPGLPGPATWKAIRERLAQAGLAPRHVHTVLVTHSHPDHFGGAARLVRESGGKVIAHEKFRFGASAPHGPEVSVDDLAAGHRHGHGGAVVEDAHVPPGEREPRATEMPSRWNDATPWGGRHPRPPWTMRLRWRAMRWLGRSFVPPVTHPIREGDVLRLAGREWFVQHTPGHTEDHFCLHDPAEGVFIAGDHVLPTITPHISGISTQSDPLNAFFQSLERVAATPDVQICLPAHGHPFDDLAGRCRAIREHHIERLDKVKGIGRLLGPASVEAFSQKLFQPRSWGAMAESETYAHLEHLRILGDAERRSDTEGRFIYETG
jgi:glyoxylase-like metal-dependent hydrolase (beta-lactamase superfamily II)